MLHKDLAKLFSRFKKDELLDLLVQQGLIKDGTVNPAGSKKSVIDRALKICERTVTGRSLALIDLFYHQTHSRNRKWDVYQLVRSELASQQSLPDPQVLESSLKSCLSPYFPVEVCVQIWNEAFWIRLQFEEGMLKASTTTATFLVHYPHSPYFITTGMRATHKNYILQALMNTLSCYGAQKVKLSGRDVQSLANLVLNKSSQGNFSQYRLRPSDINPLTKKRKRSKDEDVEFKPQSQMVNNENEQEESSRQREATAAFGNDSQPILECVQFKMETKFRGTEYAPELKNQAISCCVKFEGSSVIEGIKQLSQQGFADLPLPAHLANVHSLSGNQFLLTDRKLRSSVNSADRLAPDSSGYEHMDT